MRSFLAGLLVLLATLTGAATLVAYVAHERVLAPARAGAVADAVFDQPTLRDRLLRRAVPGYDGLPASVHVAVETLAATPAVHRGIGRLTVGEDGTVELAPVQIALARSLGTDFPEIADRIRTANVEVTVPTRYLDRVDQAREASRRLMLGGLLVTGALVLLALVVASRRRRTLGAVGVGAVVSAGLSAALLWIAPSLVRGATSGAEAAGAAGYLTAQRPAELHMLVPVAVAGAVLTLLAVLVGAARGRQPIR